MHLGEPELSALCDQVFAWERMLRGSSSILETVIEAGMLAGLPVDECMRDAAKRAYQMLDFTSSQLAQFIREQDEKGNLPSEQLQDLESSTVRFTDQA
jgi:hypothetical protein